MGRCGCVGYPGLYAGAATQDLDILVAATDRERVRVRLERAGFLSVQQLAIGGMTWRSPTGVLIDVIESHAAWVADALRSLRRDAQGLPILDLPYLVLMKVQAGRIQDLADAARMLGAASEVRHRETRELFRRWLPEALDDLERESHRPGSVGNGPLTAANTQMNLPAGNECGTVFAPACRYTLLLAWHFADEILEQQAG